MKENPHLMSLVDHLGTLRQTLIRSSIALLIGIISTLFFSKKLFDLLIQPLIKVLPSESHFITTTPFESYLVYLKTSALTGLLLATPYLVFEFWRFCHKFFLYIHFFCGLNYICSIIWENNYSN